MLSQDFIHYDGAALSKVPLFQGMLR